MIVAWVLVAVFVALVAALHINNYQVVKRLTNDNAVLKRSMSYFVNHTWMNEEGELLRVTAEQMTDKSYQVKVEYAPAEPEDKEAAAKLKDVS
jgi:hypothetical protein